MGGISGTQQDLLSLVSAALFNAPVEISEAADWGDILHEANMQSVTPLAFSAAKTLMPQEYFPQWKRYVDQIVASNIRVEWEHTQLHELMTTGVVPYVILKGASSAAYYPEPMLRVMGDVDFLVAKPDLSRAGQVLETTGFEPETDEVHYHIAYNRSDGGRTSRWEMHWEPNGLPDGAAGEILRGYLSDLHEQAVLRQALNGSYFVPSVFHHGLILLLHTAKHMIDAGVGLRHLCDWAVFVDGLSDSEFTDLYEEKLRSAGLWRFAQLLTAVAVKFLHCGERQWAADLDEALLEEMMADIFSGGNFGKKDPERFHESKLITDGFKLTVDDTGFFRHFCSIMNDRARRCLPAAKRCPILLPAGWVYVGGRYMRKVISGKYPRLRPGRMLKGASARKKLYIEFHLYEPEKK